MLPGSTTENTQVKPLKFCLQDEFTTKTKLAFQVHLQTRLFVMNLALLLNFTAKLAETQQVKQAAWYRRTCLGHE